MTNRVNIINGKIQLKTRGAITTTLSRKEVRDIVDYGAKLGYYSMIIRDEE